MTTDEFTNKFMYYDVINKLGEGSIATVYLAQHKLLERQVALKVMSIRSITTKVFICEMRQVSKLDHPHIAKTYDAGSSDGLHYIVMELFSGGTLKERLAKSPLPPTEAIDIIQQIGRAVSYAHTKGYVHYDIKPSNILFRTTGDAVLSDFGIAHLLSLPPYRSPEQSTDGNIDRQNDLYSLGALFYEMLTGEPLVSKNTATVFVPTTPYQSVEITHIWSLINKLTASRIEERFISVDDFLDELIIAPQCTARPRKDNHSIPSYSSPPSAKKHPTLFERVYSTFKTLTFLLGNEEKCSSSKKTSSQTSVEFSIFTSDTILPNSKCILDVWAFTKEEKDYVCKQAASVSRDSKLGFASGISVATDEILSITLIIPELIKEPPPAETMLWSGHATNVSFVVNIPATTKPDSYVGMVTVKHSGLMIAKITFFLVVTSTGIEKKKVPMGHVKYPRSAFASYASENRSDVLKRIQGIKTVAPDMDVFTDVINLRAGQNWFDELQNNIKSRDIFYLFWSLPASRSEWVEKEWRMALEQRGLSYISPVPLDDPDIVSPPAELGALHFNDAYLAYIKYHEMKQAIAAERRE